MIFDRYKEKTVADHAGFTLVELLVAMAVFSLLSTFLLVQYSGKQQAAA
jgi:prepilin-type N-terminal cleavage/methylation domain-containing protein